MWDSGEGYRRRKFTGVGSIVRGIYIFYLNYIQL